MHYLDPRGAFRLRPQTQVILDKIKAVVGMEVELMGVDVLKALAHFLGVLSTVYGCPCSEIEAAVRNGATSATMVALCERNTVVDKERS